MPAPKGNRFWEKRETFGREKQYTPEQLWEESLKYFTHVDNNPFIKRKTTTSPKGVTIEEIEHKKPYLLRELQVWLNISHTTWQNYRNREGYEAFFAIVKEIEHICSSQKISGAGAGLFNSNIIARLEGLTEKTENKNSGDITINIKRNEEGL